jgi:hypothetical protein
VTNSRLKFTLLLWLEITYRVNGDFVTAIAISSVHIVAKLEAKPWMKWAGEETSMKHRDTVLCEMASF